MENAHDLCKIKLNWLEKLQENAENGLFDIDNER
jgi:hypothetical protein